MKVINPGPIAELTRHLAARLLDPSSIFTVDFRVRNVDFKTSRSQPIAKIKTTEIISDLRLTSQTPGVEMRIYPLKKNAHATLIFDHQGPEIWIDWIESKIKGAGAVALGKLTASADKHNAVIRLCVDGPAWLYQYYEKFGFVQDPAGGPIMERPVQRTRAEEPVRS